MMKRISNLRAPLDYDRAKPREFAARALKMPVEQIVSARWAKQSVDARDKGDVHFVVSVDVETARDAAVRFLPRGAQCVPVTEERMEYPNLAALGGSRPVVVGLGPAGLFAALTLARMGLKPLVLERGREVRARARDVETFWLSGALDPCSNVQFGEGGAGAFSDGKLTTGISDPRCQAVLRDLYEAGAPEEILYLAKPHIGTDRLPGVVENIREKIKLLGGTVLFSHTLTDLRLEDGRVAAAVARNEAGQAVEYPTDDVVLAIGHSARDTFARLYELRVPMEAKPFSLGVRVEHRQSLIDRAQYGACAGQAGLGAADYKLSAHLPDGRGAYTFCMCPGGAVVAAASEAGMVVTNGMSAFARDGLNANSALLIGVTPADFPDDTPLGGVHLQQKWERAAYALGGGGYVAPAQLVGDFLRDVPSRGARGVAPTYRPGVRFTRLDDCLPDYAARDLREAIRQFDKRLKGFADPEAVLTAIETRSSSPVRILRDARGLSAVAGLYPCGEGAGYAGGIVSAAVDGIRCAQALAARRGENRRLDRG